MQICPAPNTVLPTPAPSTPSEPRERPADGPGGFAQALGQAVAGDPSAQPAESGANTTAKAATSGSTAEARKSLASANRLERAAADAKPGLGAGSAVAPVAQSPLSALAAELEPGASDDSTAQQDAASDAAAAGVGALLSQLQATAATLPTGLAPNSRLSTSAPVPAAETVESSRPAKGPRIDSAGALGDLARGEALSAKPASTERGKNAALALPTPSAPSPLELDATRAGAAQNAPATPTPAAEALQSQSTLLANTISTSHHATATPASAAQAAPAAGGPAEVQLRASPGSAEFGPQLGAQITTFVRDGLEHARLQLHPADMGPVLVQIQLDGQSAQIHLSADHPSTRQALQDALPQLASQLREAGLTLNGGGVSEQAQQDRRPAEEPGPGRQPAQASSAAAVDDTRRPVARRGVVDLVA